MSIPPGPARTTTPTPAPAPDDVFEDEQVEDEFEDDGITGDTGGSVDLPAPGGAWARPNGADYNPRYLLSYADTVLYRHFRNNHERFLLYGPPGTGKTAGVEAAFFPDAERNNDGTWRHYGMHSIICNVDTTEADFVGTFVQDPDTRTYPWVPGPLMRAVQDDVPLYVDEIFLADPRVLSSCLYPIMDGRDVLRIPANPNLPPIPIGPGFFVIGSGNPDVPGANFSDALRDRFEHHIEVTTDWALARKLGVPSWIVTVAQELDKDRENGAITWSPQMRSLLSFKSQNEQYGAAYAVRALIGKTPEEDQGPIIAALKKRPEVERSMLKPLRLGGHRKPRTRR